MVVVIWRNRSVVVVNVSHLEGVRLFPMKIAITIDTVCYTVEMVSRPYRYLRHTQGYRLLSPE